MATLYKKRGFWYIDYYLGGRRKSKNTKLGDSQVNLQKAEKLKKEIGDLIDSQREQSSFVAKILTENITLNEAIGIYRKTHVLGKSKSHIEMFEYIMKRLKTIVPGSTLVKEITSLQVSQFNTSLKEKLSQASQVTYFQYLASLFNFLKEDNYINQIPIGRGIRPKKARKNIINFDQDDLTAILQETRLRDERYYLAFMMFLLTGQRPGDVLRLQVGDIDLHRKIIFFRVSKTSSEFKFPIYEKLEAFLINEMDLLDRKDKLEYLFPKITVHGIGQAFRKIKRKLGLNRYHYYTLKTFRKNFATDMSDLGMTIQDVQALLDHKDPSTTLRYYANVKAEKLKNKIDKLQGSIADKIADKSLTLI